MAPAPVGRGGVTVGAVGEAVGADGTTAAVLAAAATVAVADGAAGVDAAVVVGATTVGVVAGRVPSDHRSSVGLVPRTPTMASTAIVPIVKAMERPDNCRITSLQVGRKASRAFVSFAQRQSVRTAQPASPMIAVAEVLRSAPLDLRGGPSLDAPTFATYDPRPTSCDASVRSPSSHSWSNSRVRTGRPSQCRTCLWGCHAQKRPPRHEAGARPQCCHYSRSSSVAHSTRASSR